MIDYIDGNTSALNNYEHNQSLLEQQWELSKPEKCEQVVEYAIKIMEGLVSNQEFNWVFNDYYLESDEDGEVFTVNFTETLHLWNLGEDLTPEQTEQLKDIALAALEGSSHILFDVELDELSTWSTGEDRRQLMIKGVIYG
jgi:hypothetical protein